MDSIYMVLLSLLSRVTAIRYRYVYHIRYKYRSCPWGARPAGLSSATAIQRQSSQGQVKSSSGATRPRGDHPGPASCNFLLPPLPYVNKKSKKEELHMVLADNGNQVIKKTCK